jgi:hypothetical protein
MHRWLHGEIRRKGSACSRSGGQSAFDSKGLHILHGHTSLLHQDEDYGIALYCKASID